MTDLSAAAQNALVILRRPHQYPAWVRHEAADALAADLAASRAQVAALWAVLDRIDACCEGTPKQPYAAIHAWIGDALTALAATTAPPERS